MEPPPPNFAPPPAISGGTMTSEVLLEENDVLLFKGEIVIVKKFSEVEAALAKLLENGEAQKQGVGFDMEWQPEFAKGQINPIAVIQLATDDVAVLFMMRHLGSMPFQLRQVLGGDSLLKIGQSLDIRDSEKLMHEFGLTLTRTVDISQVARNMGIRKTGLKNLAQAVFGVKLNKHLATSDWGKWDLTPQQLTYAATDAFVTRKLYHALLSPPPESLLFQQAILWQQQQQQMHQQQLMHEEQNHLQQQQRYQQRLLRQQLKQQRKQGRQAQHRMHHNARKHKAEQSLLPLDLHAYPPLPSKPQTVPEDSPLLPSASKGPVIEDGTKPRRATDPPTPLRHYLEMAQKPPSPAVPPAQLPESSNNSRSLSRQQQHPSSQPKPIPTQKPQQSQQPQYRQPSRPSLTHQYQGQGQYVNAPSPQMHSAAPAQQKNYCHACKRWFRNGHALRQHNRALHFFPSTQTSPSTSPVLAPAAPSLLPIHQAAHIPEDPAIVSARPAAPPASVMSMTPIEDKSYQRNKLSHNNTTTSTATTAPTTVPTATVSAPTTTQTARMPAPHATNFRCPICGVLFLSLKACKQHQQDKKHYAYFCQQCNIPFGTRSACEQHQLAKKHQTAEAGGPIHSEEREGSTRRDVHSSKASLPRGETCSCASCQKRSRDGKDEGTSPSGEKIEEGTVGGRRREGRGGSTYVEQQRRKEEEEATQQHQTNPIILNLLRELQRMPPPSHPHPQHHPMPGWFGPPVFPPRMIDTRFRNF